MVNCFRCENTGDTTSTEMLAAGTWVYWGMYVPCIEVFAGIYCKTMEMKISSDAAVALAMTKDKV